jgi:cell division protein FtsW (lipid II flippase)
MPYKDLERKKEWERLHRPERLARRRELRSIQAAQRAARPEEPSTEHGGLGFLIPIVAGGALAAYDPKLGMGAGGLTLVIATFFSKGWRWWVVGIVILAVALFFYWNDKNAAKTRSGETN